MSHCLNLMKSMELETEKFTSVLATQNFSTNGGEAKRWQAKRWLWFPKSGETVEKEWCYLNVLFCERNNKNCCPCSCDWLVCWHALWQENLPWRWSWIPKSRALNFHPRSWPQYSPILKKGVWVCKEGNLGEMVPVSKWPESASSLTCEILLEVLELVPSWASQTLWGRDSLESTSKIRILPGDLKISSQYVTSTAWKIARG